jgi:hypothetical protein
MLQADVVTPRLTTSADGLSTYLYGVTYFYPYPGLLIYHVGHKLVVPIPDADAARRYFETVSPGRNDGCQPGHEGHGVRIF